MKKDVHEELGLRPGQSLELLQELHILTREGRVNQDSRRKLKQVLHLVQFIEKLLLEVPAQEGHPTLADHGATQVEPGHAFTGTTPEASSMGGGPTVRASPRAPRASRPAR